MHLKCETKRIKINYIGYRPDNSWHNKNNSFDHEDENDNDDNVICRTYYQEKEEYRTSAVSAASQ